MPTEPDDQNYCRKSNLKVCYGAMERPKGVTVMACVFFFMGVGVLQGGIELLLELQLQPKHIAFYVANVLFQFIVGFGLLKMQSWSRWLAIASSVNWFLFIPRQVHTLQLQGLVLLPILLRCLFSVWVIWYLFRSRVKAAFSGPASALGSTSQS